VRDRVPARSFFPRPSVDAAMLTIERRSAPLLDDKERPAYTEFVRTCFESSTLRVALRPFMADRRFRTPVNKREFPLDAQPAHLDLGQWIRLYRGLVGE
jgi:23S rRNA (adenine-N6)-dimethyltransferase